MLIEKTDTSVTRVQQPQQRERRRGSPGRRWPAAGSRRPAPPKTTTSSTSSDRHRQRLGPRDVLADLVGDVAARSPRCRRAAPTVRPAPRAGAARSPRRRPSGRRRRRRRAAGRRRCWCGPSTPASAAGRPTSTVVTPATCSDGRSARCSSTAARNAGSSTLSPPVAVEHHDVGAAPADRLLDLGEGPGRLAVGVSKPLSVIEPKTPVPQPAPSARKAAGEQRARGGGGGRSGVRGTRTWGVSYDAERQLLS